MLGQFQTSGIEQTLDKNDESNDNAFEFRNNSNFYWIS